MWKITKWKKVLDKCNVMHAIKQPKNLLSLLYKPSIQNCISEKHGCITMNAKSPAVIHAHHI